MEDIHKMRVSYTVTSRELVYHKLQLKIGSSAYFIFRENPKTPKIERRYINEQNTQRKEHSNIDSSKAKAKRKNQKLSRVVQSSR